ncbi:D-aminopeptidase [Catellatospora sp. TT07R-123]|uniref:P1 family peptidase n=1 Tax=Catellatospora sp. TT07R-123 TaxID=2733863 RepID=UPI001B0B2EEC|nr:P1 family peptidase [Catellatospora sp. TT07R-123]GHJ43701.1 D-aminopeptidase [Catellatospora sp. TT07R-123]
MEASQEPRRARELDIVVGELPPGPLNAVTDVPGIRVGHTTLVEGADIRTGVTAIVPDQLATRSSLPAGLYVGNGYGKLVGSTQVVELGEIETPVVLTATLSVFRAADALLDHVLAQPGREMVQSLNPLVAETNDGFLSDIRARPIRAEHVLHALGSARGGLPAEGAAGAGTGTAALGFKAGIGTASRLAATRGGPVTVGVLVQANFSGVLRVLGVPVPREAVGVPTGPPLPPYVPEHPGNSCVIVVATDGRFDARQLGRVARRAVFAMGRVGSDFAGGSGDYALALSTAEVDGPAAAESELEPVFAAVQEAVEEALLNSLFMARTTVGFRGRVKFAVPHDRLLNLLGRGRGH